MSQGWSASHISYDDFIFCFYLFSVIGKHRKNERRMGKKWKDESGDGSLMNSEVDAHAIYKPDGGDT